MITLGVSPRRLPAVASMVLDKLRGRGPVELFEEGAGVGIYTKDGSNISAWIPLWELKSPAATIEGLAEWLIDGGVPSTIVGKPEFKPIGVPPPRPPPTPAVPAQMGFEF